MKKVLVIDDEEPIRSTIMEFLRFEGYQALGAENGRVGLRMAQEHLPDLILCDVMMPELDGYGVLTALRKDVLTATIPFIFLTGKTDQDHLRVGMNLGADDYITKPFTRKDLLRSIAVRFEKRETYGRQFEEKLDRLRGNLARSLPHELLTPLNIILGYSEILAADYDSMEKEETLDMIQRINVSGKRLHRLVQNFLLYAELETVATDPDRVKAMLTGEISNPKKIISEIVSEKAKQADRGEDLKVDVENTTIRISETNFRKIIEELVDNALKYSNAGTPVEILGSIENNRFHLSVIDHGRGMTPEALANVGAYMQFERKIYEQQGSGLGLTIAKRLVQLHGGEFHIESAPGKQTVVRLILR